ncbi:MAG: MoaD/ThiS family protein [Gammaproteobacteria bacterium]|nr:MoaD/ThiS family protein [Gammaproteobacteria bacterium]
MTAVRVPSALHDYTGGQSKLAADGGTVDAVLDDIDRQFPGLKFRIVTEHGAVRRHIKIFLNQDMIEALSTPVGPHDEVHVILALSGG